MGVAGSVGQKIETIVTKSQGTVYLLWWTARTSTRFWAEGVTAVRLHNGRIESVPFFKTKKALLSSIQFGYGIDSDAEFRFVKTPEYTLLVPIISDEYRFSGKFFKYVFDGSKFVFSGVQ